MTGPQTAPAAPWPLKAAPVDSRTAPARRVLERVPNASWNGTGRSACNRNRLRGGLYASLARPGRQRCQVGPDIGRSRAVVLGPGIGILAGRRLAGWSSRASDPPPIALARQKWPPRPKPNNRVIRGKVASPRRASDRC
jgi:hypothetical protein